MDELAILRNCMAVGAVLLLLHEFLVAHPTETERRWERIGNVAGAVFFLAAAVYITLSR